MSAFREKVAIVTGGAAGIGRALCEELARRGSVVSVADLDGADLNGPIHLIGGQSSTVGVVHGLDQVVDEALNLGRRQLIR